MKYNKKSLRNLNPGRAIVWNGKRFKSLQHMSRVTGVPYTSIQNRFHADRPIKGHYIDELI